MYTGCNIKYISCFELCSKEFESYCSKLYWPQPDGSIRGKVHIHISLLKGLRAELSFSLWWAWSKTKEGYYHRETSVYSNGKAAELRASPGAWGLQSAVCNYRSSRRQKGKEQAETRKAEVMEQGSEGPGSHYTCASEPLSSPCEGRRLSRERWGQVSQCSCLHPGSSLICPRLKILFLAQGPSSLVQVSYTTLLPLIHDFRGSHQPERHSGVWLLKVWVPLFTVKSLLVLCFGLEPVRG